MFGSHNGSLTPSMHHHVSSTSRYLNDPLNVDNIHFENMVHRIDPAELQLNKDNASDTEAVY